LKQSKADGFTQKENLSVMLIIDRFEGDFAVVETSSGGFVNIPRADLPAAAREGDVLVIGLNKTETEERKERIDGLMNKLFKD
jgi:hypothetical protein